MGAAWADVHARRKRLLAVIKRNAALGMLAPTLQDHMDREGISSKSVAQADFLWLEGCGHIRRMFQRARAVEPTRPATVQHFICENVNGEARLVPLAVVHDAQEGRK